MNVSLVSRRRLALAALVALLGVFGLLAVSAPALAKTSACADQVVADWYDNQRVDRLYPLHCYRDAIAGLPLDITDYSDAKEAILRALTYAQAGQNDPGPNARPKPNSPIKPVAFRNTSGLVTAVPVQTPGTGVASPQQQNTAGPSSVPIPLIVLAGLAGLLLIAGGAGYVARRMQSRRGGPPPTA